MTVPSADAGVVLASPPPYQMQPWLPAGLPVVAGLLEAAGLRTALARVCDDPSATPPAVAEATLATVLGDPPLAERLARIRAAAERERRYFDRIVQPLLA